MGVWGLGENKGWGEEQRSVGGGGSADSAEKWRGRRNIRDFDSPLHVMVCNKTGQRVIRMTPLHECIITRSYRVIKMTTV